jgi:hypothetical protein
MRSLRIRFFYAYAVFFYLRLEIKKNDNFAIINHF